MCTPRSKSNSIGEDEAVLRSDSVPVSTYQRRQPGGPTTPLSAPGKALSHTKIRGEVRTRLMNKFNSMESVERSQTANAVYTRQSSSLSQTEGVANGPWACISTGYVTVVWKPLYIYISWYSLS